ncbi:hypothetical protein TNCV_1373901 [Trichonephila clavipes]|nr:hypothetical protein TNCV_1373901 [Trichonephila clavipes]
MDSVIHFLNSRKVKPVVMASEHASYNSKLRSPPPIALALLLSTVNQSGHIACKISLSSLQRFQTTQQQSRLPYVDSIASFIPARAPLKFCDGTPTTDGREKNHTQTCEREPRVNFEATEDDIVWENDDAGTISEVNCNNGSDESFLKYDTDG